MSVGQICSLDVDVAHAEESISRAAERMRQHAVGALVVVNAQQNPIGIVTDRDLVTRVLAPGHDAHTTAVRNAMTCTPKTIREDESLETAIAIMRLGGFRRLPVVNKRGALAGIVALDDILCSASPQMRHRSS